MQPSVKMTLGAVLWAAMFLHPPTLLAQGTAFTYQGRLDAEGVPANGLYDLRFTVHDAASGGSPVGGVLTNAATAVSNGLLTVTLDFGANFPGADRWLDIGVRTNGGGAFTALIPRQQITATPYAITAGTFTGTLSPAQLSGVYSNALILNHPANVFTGAFTGNGAGLSNLNAVQLSGAVPSGLLSNAWKISGNAGTTPGTHFLGTTDNQALELKVNNQRALRIENAWNPLEGYSPNLVGGFSGNLISNGVLGAAIGGGGSSNFPNRVGGYFATVVGGEGNLASGSGSTVMGSGCTASGSFATAMGSGATASGGASTAIGHSTTADGIFATAMGNRARALHTGTFVWADSQNADFSSTDLNQFCVRAGGGMRLSGNTRVYFGAAMRQMLNLWDETFGIGIQSGVQYSRVGAGNGFAWYAGGVHNDNTYNSGGGVTLMTLNATALYVNGTFVSSSDRNRKENFQPVEPSEVLAKVVALPITQWNFKADRVRHIGPMAQDFHAAFGLGADDKHIATVDADGVALAAIQGLNQKLEETRSELKRRDAENAALKAELKQIKQLLDSLASQLNGGAR